MSVGTTYNEWYIRADQAWDAYHDCLDQHVFMLEDHLAEVEEIAALQMEMKQWKEAAEYAEKQMAEMEKCMGYPVHCQPAQDLMFPFGAAA